MSLDIRNMSVPEIVYHNYMDIGGTKLLGEPFREWKMMRSSIKKHKYCPVPKHYIFKMAYSIMLDRWSNKPNVFLLERLPLIINAQFVMYSWGVNKTIVNLSDSFIRMAREKYNDPSKVSINMDIFKTIPTGTFIYGNIDPENKVGGTYICADYQTKNIQQDVPDVPVICLNNIDKLVLSNVDENRNEQEDLLTVMPVPVMSDFIPIEGKSIAECMNAMTSDIQNKAKKEVVNKMPSVYKDAFIDSFEKADIVQWNVLRVILFIRDWLENDHAYNVFKVKNDITMITM